MDDQVEKNLWLLKTMVYLGNSAVSGEAISQPYVDCGAIRVVDGHAEFHRDKFLHMLAQQLVQQVMKVDA